MIGTTVVRNVFMIEWKLWCIFWGGEFYVDHFDDSGYDGNDNGERVSVDDSVNDSDP